MASPSSGWPHCVTDYLWISDPPPLYPLSARITGRLHPAQFTRAEDWTSDAVCAVQALYQLFYTQLLQLALQSQWGGSVGKVLLNKPDDLSGSL